MTHNSRLPQTSPNIVRDFAGDDSVDAYTLCSLPHEQMLELVEQQRPGLISQMREEIGKVHDQLQEPIDPSSEDFDKQLRKKERLEQKMVKMGQVTKLHVEVGCSEFWPNKRVQSLFEAYAMTVCQLCPVQKKEACLQSSVVKDQDARINYVAPGVWGGLNDRQRKDYFIKRSRRN